MTYKENVHIPVLIDIIIECINLYLETDKEVSFFDGTFGGGGYFSRIYDNFINKDLIIQKAYAVDLDQNVESFLDHKKYPNSVFLNKSFDDAIISIPKNSVDLIVLDLGFSTNQLQLSNIGLSYKKLDQEFDLRFNTEIYGKNNTPAWLKLRGVKSANDLSKIIYTNCGEEFSARIARKIFALPQIQQKQKIYNSHIVECIKEAVPIKFHKKLNQILSRVYQAFRIWVNDELGCLSEFLSTFHTRLKKNGLLCVVSFHSLEDKLVTKAMRNLSAPIFVDEYGNKENDYELITKKSIKPTIDEVEKNKASRSGTLRILKKLV